MDKKSAVMLKALLEYCCPGEEKSLLKYLSPDMARVLTSQSTPSQPVVVPALQIRKVFNKIHYSWLTSLFHEDRRSTYPLYFTLLSRQQAVGVARLLKTPLEIASVPRRLRPVLMSVLTKRLASRELLPAEYLPASPLNVLLRASKQQLVKAIHILGLYDLAAEMKKVVDKQVLEKALACLDAKDREYLKFCMRQGGDDTGDRHEKLLHSLEDLKVFNNKLHQKGIARFAKALAFEDGSLIWYVTRRLDRGRGSDIEKLASHVSKTTAVRPYKMQLLDVIAMISEKSGAGHETV